MRRECSSLSRMASSMRELERLDTSPSRWPVRHLATLGPPYSLSAILSLRCKVGPQVTLPSQSIVSFGMEVTLGRSFFHFTSSSVILSWVTQVVTGLELFPQIFTRLFQPWVTQVMDKLEFFSTILAGLISSNPVALGGPLLISSLRVLIFFLKQNRHFFLVHSWAVKFVLGFLTDNSPQDCLINFPQPWGI